MDCYPATFPDLVEISKCSKTVLPISYDLFTLTWMQNFQPFEMWICKAHVHGGNEPQIYGYIIGKRADKDCVHIHSIGVYPEFRRKGVGTRLLNCFKNDNTSLYVHAENDSAMSFYLRNGYRFKGIVKNYYKGANLDTDNLDAFVMEKLQR